MKWLKNIFASLIGTLFWLITAFFSAFALIIKLLFIFPAAFVLKFPLWLILITTAVIAFVPVLGSLLNIGLWIWAFIVCLSTPVTTVSIIFYILFALTALDFIQALIKTFIEYLQLHSHY